MAFAFNFSGSSDISIVNRIEPCVEQETAPISVPCKYIPFQEISVQVADLRNATKTKCGHLEIQYVTQKLIASEIMNSEFIGNQQSDLLPGKYEGGLKVWECSFDLAQYIVEKKCIQENDSVLELGCGAGLPGIAAYLLGASVTFQDFNSEVLELVTASNVLLNTPVEQQCNIPQKCEFLSGDWQSILEKFYGSRKSNKLFDIILTSETIYEKSNQKKLLNLMKAVLKESGVIYLASKVHYFGVGGGVADFEELVKRDGTFVVSTVLRVDAGVERRILKLTIKNL